MTEVQLMRRSHAAAIMETIARLEKLYTSPSSRIVRDLWDDLAEIELGWPWHDIGPDGVLDQAQDMLRRAFNPPLGP
jgi:hypothetical protein